MLLLPPATKLGQGYVFPRVCDSVHGGLCLSACRDSRHLREQTPPSWDQTPPSEQTPPPSRHTPPNACWEIRPTSRRYASYWNAILLLVSFTFTPSLYNFPYMLAHHIVACAVFLSVKISKKGNVFGSRNFHSGFVLIHLILLLIGGYVGGVLHSADHSSFTTRKISLKQANVFTPVCHSVHSGVSA